MKTLVTQKVFSVGNKAYLWGDVMLAAKLCGEWAKLEEELREGIACVKLAEAEHNGPPTAEVNAAGRAFRLERDLISAEETENWLESWGLTVQDWLGYLYRALARERWAASVEASAVQKVTDEEVDAVIKGEAVLSGELAGFARKLAARAAIYARAQEQAASEIDASCGYTDEREPAQASGASATDPNCLLPGIDPEACRAAAEFVRVLDRSFVHFAGEMRTARAIKEQMRLHYLGWIRLRCLYASFPEEEMAREAAHCVRKDGMHLEAVASQAKAYLQEASFYLEQLESDLSSRLVGARKGEFLGPLAFRGSPTLFLVLDKILPATADPELRYKAEQSALKSAIDLEVAERVKWHRHL